MNRRSLYKDVWRRHWAAFERTYKERFEEKYGPLVESKKAEVKKLLSCGDFASGFYRYGCPDCGTQLILPFSCKSRLCLSCRRKKLFGWSVNLSQILNTALRHDHITFTIPGQLNGLLFERGFRAARLTKLAAMLYQRSIKKISALNGSDWKGGILATLHKSGNGLNYNPHVHMIATRELVNVATGEIREVGFLSYREFRYKWMNVLLRHLVRTKILSAKEAAEFRGRYRNGFHVFFQPVAGNENDVLFRTAEYLATGFFHNSQIIRVDHERRTITFRFRSWVERGTRKKRYSVLTLDILEFMARMLFYLPDRHRKNIRYYGLYASTHRTFRVQREKRACVWEEGIRNSFDVKPTECPDCGREMNFSIIYSYQAPRVYREIRKRYTLQEGYFRPIRGP